MYRLRASVQIHEDPREQRGDDEDPHRRDDHGLGGGEAHALRAAGGSQTVEATHQRNDEGENERLQQALRDVVVFERLIGVGPVLDVVRPMEK